MFFGSNNNDKQIFSFSYIEPSECPRPVRELSSWGRLLLNWRPKKCNLSAFIQECHLKIDMLLTTMIFTQSEIYWFDQSYIQVALVIRGLLFANLLFHIGKNSQKWQFSSQNWTFYRRIQDSRSEMTKRIYRELRGKLVIKLKIIIYKRSQTLRAKMCVTTRLLEPS